MKFWEYLNREVQNAQTEGAGIIIQMDGNLWAGDIINPGDPKPQNGNGKMFEEFLLKNNTISVVNASPLCEGKFTRIRNMKNGTQQKTCIDYFLVCDQIEPLVSKMTIDEGDEISLTRYRGKVVQTDHKMLKLEVNLSFHKQGHHERVEVFNVRNKVNQKEFCTFTSKDNRFTKCFISCEESVDI